MGKRRVHPRTAERAPILDNALGRVGGGVDLLPKSAGELLLLVTDGSRPDPGWIVQSGDHWMACSREPTVQARVVDDYRTRVWATGSRAKQVAATALINELTVVTRNVRDFQTKSAGVLNPFD